MKQTTRFNLHLEVLKVGRHNFCIELQFNRDDLLTGVKGVYAEALEVAKQVITEEEAKSMITYGQMGAVFFYFKTRTEAVQFFEKHIDLFKKNKHYFNWILWDEYEQLDSNT